MEGDGEVEEVVDEEENGGKSRGRKKPQRRSLSLQSKKYLLLDS